MAKTATATATAKPANELQVPVGENQPKTKEVALKMSKEDLVKAFGNKSSAIRGMSAIGCTTGEIAKALGIIYQHARNVLKRPLKRDIKAQRDEAGKGTTANAGA